MRIERYLVVEDAGRVVNPMIADGQVRGGVAQGIANALLEEVIYAEDGNILTGTLADYALPTAAENPAIEIHHLETISPATATGAKGLGEGGAIGAPAAIANAITDALAPFGVEIAEIPATPPCIRALIRSSGRGRSAAMSCASPSMAKRRRWIEARTTLADTLRDACGFTGTHLGCEHGMLPAPAPCW